MRNGNVTLSWKHGTKAQDTAEEEEKIINSACPEPQK